MAIVDDMLAAQKSKKRKRMMKVGNDMQGKNGEEGKGGNSEANH